MIFVVKFSPQTSNGLQCHTIGYELIAYRLTRHSYIGFFSYKHEMYWECADNLFIVSGTTKTNQIK